MFGERWQVVWSRTRFHTIPALMMLWKHRRVYSPHPPKKGRAVHDTSSQDQQQPTVQNQHYINIFLSSMRNKSADRKCLFYNNLCDMRDKLDRCFFFFGGVDGDSTVPNEHVDLT